jgi:hypothetical protein
MYPTGINKSMSVNREVITDAGWGLGNNRAENALKLTEVIGCFYQSSPHLSSEPTLSVSPALRMDPEPRQYADQ